MISDKVNVAIIDNGIEDKNLPLEDELNFMDYSLCPNRYKETIKKTRKNYYYEKHGTVCANIVNKYCKDARLYSLKIFDETLETTIDSLIDAFGWCLKNNIEVVNVSLGSVQWGDFCAINKIMQRLVEEDICVVAALDNNNYYTVPASLSQVIGVVAHPFLSENRYFGLEKSYIGIDVVASAQHSISCCGDIIETPTYNSFATPFIVSEVCNILLQDRKKSIKTIKERLLLRSGETILHSLDAVMEKKKPFIFEKASFNLTFEIPIIEVIRDRTAALYVQRYLYEQGCVSVIVSSDINHELFLYEYVKQQWDAKRFVNAVHRKYNCDAIILLVQHKSEFSSYDIDILLEKDEGIWKIYFENVEKRRHTLKRACSLLFKILTE